MTTAANDNGSAIELRCGQWQDVLADVECDALITDPPYGQRTHDGNAEMDTRFERTDLSYARWTADDVASFVAHWAQRTRSWMVCMTSDDLITPYRDAYVAAGRADFAPVPVLTHRPRLGGDGPGSGAVYLLVARPRSKAFASWGSLPCWYNALREPGSHIGGKPLALMRHLVRDYSRPGDLICDPCAGGATTLLAAAIEGRRAIGAEMDPVTYAKAQARIARGYTPVMRFGDEQPKPVQQSLLTAAGEER